jgi:alpha-tubulin suppressor-like RCC1 family protein
MFGVAEDWIDVATGENHTVAIKEDGTLWAWGLNSDGQLGNNSNIGLVVSPISVNISKQNWKSVIAGNNYNIAIKSDNTTYAWGENSKGQLGVNSCLGFINVPMDCAIKYSIGSPINWSDCVIVGYTSRYCAGIDDTGHLYTWGRSFPYIAPSYSPRSYSSSISWKQIATGGDFFVSINGTDGLAYAWGDNVSGKLGDNSTTSRSVPTSVSSTISWKQISAGYNHTVGINGANGLAYAWGNNASGQLGDNSTTSRSVPTSVSSTISWKQISAGYNHTVGINGANGLAYAWGNNAYGQLGDNSTTSRSVPTSVSSTISWKTIRAGYLLSLGISSDNKLYGWGENSSRQIGDGTIINKSVPVISNDPEYQTSQIQFKSICCTASVGTNGDPHSVGIELSTGLAYAWGNNDCGQLGDNTKNNCYEPTSVSSTISWKQIACGCDDAGSGGSGFTVGINGANGLAYAWGSNDTGQLGDNSTTDKSVPTSVSSTISWKQVACGVDHTVGINGANGLAYAWGRNKYGQCAGDTTINYSVPTSVSSTISWKTVRAGGYFTVGIASDNKLWSWGRNNIYQCGYGLGIPSNSSIPTSVGITNILIKNLYVGKSTSTITRNDGSIWGWGDNTYSQLGLNQYKSISYPTTCMTTMSFRSISSIYQHTVAIVDSTGLAYTWGSNTYGQLGDNSTANRFVPTSVSSTISWKQIACGYQFTAGINGANGLAYAWGRNEYGQLGNNSTTNSSVPTSVSSTISWKQIACGYQFVVGINGANGLAYAWGDNAYGQLGDKSTTSRSVPTSVSSTISWKQIASGDYHSIGINGANGLAYGWGFNFSGELGNNATAIGVSTPTSVVSTISWKQIDCGTGLSMGINGSNGLAYGWGQGNYGQIGNNSNQNQSVPTSVSSTISWKEVRCGGSQFTIGIDAATGLSYAWGRNDDYGQLGDNTMINKSIPTSIPSTISWKQIDTSQSGVIGINGENEKLYWWGGNYSGELGGIIINVDIPQRMCVIPGL